MKVLKQRETNYFIVTLAEGQKSYVVRVDRKYRGGVILRDVKSTTRAKSEALFNQMVKTYSSCGLKAYKNVI